MLYERMHVHALPSVDAQPQADLRRLLLLLIRIIKNIHKDRSPQSLKPANYSLDK